MSEYNILKLLDDRGIKYASAGVHNVKIKCFSGLHEDVHPSLLVNFTTGEYHCFVCRAKGNIIGYFIDNKEITYTESLYYAKTTYEEKSEKSEKQIFTDLKKRLQRSKITEHMTVLEPPTKPINFNYYLTSRGFTKEDFIYWDIRVVDKQDDPYNGWIYVPIYFKNVLRTYFLRSTKSKHKIFGYYFDENLQKNIGYPRSDILYGYDKIIDFTQDIYLFEGIFDKIWFDRTNKQSLALLSNIITKDQLQHVKKFKKVVLALDNDDASLHLVKSATVLLNYDIEVRVWRPPLGLKDANVCTIRQLIEQTYKEIALKDFINSKEYEIWSLTNAITKSNVKHC